MLTILVQNFNEALYAILNCHHVNLCFGGDKIRVLDHRVEYSLDVFSRCPVALNPILDFVDLHRVMGDGLSR